MTLSAPTLRKLATDVLIRGNVIPCCAIQGETLICMNARCVALLGRDGGEMEGGVSLRDIVDTADWEQVSRSLSHMIAHPGTDACVTFSTRRKDGSIVDLELSGAVATGQQEGVLVSVITDVSEKSRLSLLAFHDALTGLPNRSLFFDRLRQAMIGSRRSGRGFAVLACDLDRFKAVNDTYGHEIGDAVLQVVADRLRSCCREVDTAARLGGDEFALILPGVVDRSHAALVAARVIKALEPPIALANVECTIGVSIGIAFYPQHAQTVHLLLRDADTAMYASKARGKNQFSFADAAAHESARQSGHFVNWSEFHTTGVVALDDHHRKLIAMVEKLGLDLAAGEDIERVRTSLQVLIAFAESHFAAEEALMEQYSTEGRQSHIEMHRQLLDNARHLAIDLDESRTMLIMDTLREWLLRHIDTADKELALQLHEKGYGEVRARRKSAAAVRPAARGRKDATRNRQTGTGA